MTGGTTIVPQLHPCARRELPKKSEGFKKCNYRNIYGILQQIIASRVQLKVRVKIQYIRTYAGPPNEGGSKLPQSKDFVFNKG
jgi:hypothetical protein